VLGKTGGRQHTGPVCRRQNSGLARVAACGELAGAMRAATLILAALVFAAFLVVDTTAVLRLAAACITGAFGYAPAAVLAVVAGFVLMALFSRKASPRAHRKVPAGNASNRRGTPRNTSPKPASGRKRAAKIRQER
jgi:hypothetical protein